MPASRKALLIALLLILAAGVVVAADLSYIHFKIQAADSSYSSFCNISTEVNCDAVSASPWSTLFGIPIAILGVLTYLFSMALAFAVLTGKPWKIPGAPVYLTTIGAGSTAYSIYLAWLCFAEIGSWCILCMALYFVNVAFFILALLTKGRPFREFPGLLSHDIRWIFGHWARITAVVLVGLLALGAFGAGYVYEKKHEPELSFRLIPLEKPLSPEGENVIGNPKAETTIVVFSDFQCPFCKRMEITLEKLAAKHPRLRVVHRDFPLDMACNPLVQKPFHQHACQAAFYANCAARQGKYSEYCAFLHRNQRAIGKPMLEDSIRSLQLDPKRMEACLKGDAVKDQLARDLSAGIEQKIAGTPTLFLNGKYRLEGKLTPEALERIIWLKPDEYKKYISDK